MVFCAACRAAASPSSHACHCARRSWSTSSSRPSNFLFACSRLGAATRGSALARLAGHAHLFQLHIQVEDLFQQIGGNPRRILSVFSILARVLLANLRAFQLQQVFGAVKGIFQGAIGVVEQRGVGQAPLPFVLPGAGKAVGVHFAAQAVKLVLQRGQVDGEAALQAEDLEKIAAGRRLNLAAMRAKERGIVVADGTGPTGDRNCGIEITFNMACNPYG